jgi:hypothetical protein
MNKPYRNFDLPKQHLDDRHYIPERARTKSEIDRRRSMPAGTILAEHQRDGLVVANEIMRNVEQPEDITFATNMIAMSGLNASWYSYAADSPVMRRRLNLPILSDEETGWYETSIGLLVKTQHALVGAVAVADSLVKATRERRPTARYQQQLGRRLGNVSLGLACVELSNSADAYSAFDMQHFAREQSLRTLEQARTFSDRIGSHPSIAQLADPNSDLAIYLRRHAPNGVFESYEEAIEVLPRSV